jgi:hypothetical protein
MQSYQTRLAQMRERRSAVTGMLKQYYEDCLRHVQPDSEAFAESVIRFAEQQPSAPPVEHHAGR